MADGRGGADSPSNTATGRQGNPAVAPPPLDGAFLLQLLQKPTQPAGPSSLPQHHFDPAVAAVGPSHPFLLHEPRHPPPAHFPEPLIFSSHPFSASPGLFPPRGFLPLGGSEVSGSGGPGNLPFFPFDHQTLGVSVGGVLPLAASPPRSDHIQRLGQFPSDRTLVDHMVTSRHLLGPQGNKERSPFRPPPGFQRPQEGGATEGDRESATRGGSDGRLTRREQGKAQEERSSGSVQRNRPLYGGRERNSALQKPMMEGQRRLPDHVNQLQDFQRSVTGNKRDGNYKVRIASQSEEVPVHHPPIIDVTLRNDTSDGNSQGKHEYSPDDHDHRNQIFASQRCNSSTAVLEKDAGESDQDSECEADGEDNIALMQKLGIKDKSVIANYSTKNKIPTQDHLEMDSTMLELDHEVEKIVAPSTNSRSKEIRSDLSRGHRVSTQRVRMMRRTIRCRYDIEGLNPSLLSIFQSLVPAEEEKAKQKKLLLSLQDLVNKEWPNAKLYLYGSCANTFGVSKSDIDVCLAIDNHDLSKSDILLKLAEILESGNLQNVQALTHARVPIVKLMDPVTELSCDICVNNLLAVVNTKLLKDYAQIDERLRQLVFIVKHWAKSRRVNETYQGTLSSYAYVLMCIHFLQQRRPAILPCLQAMEATYSVTVDNTKCAYFDQVGRLRNFGSRNKESIPRLLWAFFQYWAYHHDYANDVISIRTGSIISKQAKDWTRRIGNDRHLICIEDPFDTSHDLGRVVDKYSIKILREEFERAAEVLQFDPSPCVTLFEPYMPGSMQR